MIKVPKLAPQKIWKPENRKWNLVKFPWDLLCLKCCSVCDIRVKGVNFLQCDIPVGCIKTN